MLAKSAIKKFRERKLDSYRWMKKLTRRELMQMVRDLDPQPEFISKKKMWNHQLVAFLVGVYIGYFLFFLDMGLGKTRVILELIAYFKKRGDKPCALIAVPNDAGIESWVMQVEEHRPDLSCVPMYGNSNERMTMLGEDADLFVINYDGLIWMCGDLREIGGRKSKKLIINEKRLAYIASRFNLICLDESTEIMNHRSLTFKVCNKIGLKMIFRYGMAGIPFGRDPHALWSQFFFCDHGETLGETLGIFRGAFFKTKENYWSGYYDYVFDKKWTKKLNRVLQNRSIHYDEKECRGMPPMMYKPVHVPFTQDMKAYYNKIVDKLKADKRNLRLTRGSFLNMRQIASGFIGLIDDETGTRAQIEFPENPKIDALMQIIREIPDNCSFLIFYQYIWTGDRISKELTKAKIKHGRLKGNQKDRPQVLRDFTNNPTIRGLVISNEIGAFSLNLQKANYEIFVESPVSPITRGQAEKRIRPSLQPLVKVPGKKKKQRRRCFYIDIIMSKNTADESIQKFLKQGKSLEEALMKGNAKLKLEKV